MQAVFPIYLLNSTVSFLSVISCVRRGRLFHRAGGEAIRFTARAAVSSAGAGLRGPPNGTRAGPVAAVPPAAAGPARLTRRDGHASLSQAPLYIDTRNAQKVSSILYFPKKLFRAVWNGDENFSRRGGFGRIPSLSFSCVRRGRLFHRAGGEAIRFTARAAVSSAGAGLRGPPNGTRAGPVAAVPPAAAGPARRTRRNGHTPLSQAPIYIDTRNAQKVAPVLHFFKKIFSRCGGMGIKMGRKRAARPPGRLGRNGRSARRVAGGLDKNGEKAGGGKRAKRGAGPARSETRSARAPRDGKRPAERGGSGRRDVGRVRRVSARRARKGAKKRRLAPALLGRFVRSCAVPQRAVKGRGGDPVQQISAFRPGMRAEALVSSSRPTRLA